MSLFGAQDPLSAAQAQIDIKQNELQKAKTQKQILKCFQNTISEIARSDMDAALKRSTVSAIAINKRGEFDKLVLELCKLTMRSFSFFCLSYNGNIQWADLRANDVNEFLQVQMQIQNISTSQLDKAALCTINRLNNYLRPEDPRLLDKIMTRVKQNSHSHICRPAENIHGVLQQNSGLETFNKIMAIARESSGTKTNKEGDGRRIEPTLALGHAHRRLLKYLFTQLGIDKIISQWNWDHFNRSMHWRAYVYDNVIFEIDGGIIYECDVSDDEQNLFDANNWGPRIIRRQMIDRWVIETPANQGIPIVNTIFYDKPENGIQYHED